MGKIGQRAIRLVSSLSVSAEAEEILVLCPFLADLDPVVGMWLGPLAWHNCNAALLASLFQTVPSGKTVFAAVFCADPFNPTDDILRALRAKGVAGVTNLPSVSFFDGEFGETLNALNLGKARELAFLCRARALGFRIIGCASDPADARNFLSVGAELIIEHAGAPVCVRLPGRSPRPRSPTHEFQELQVPMEFLDDLLRKMQTVSSA